MSALAQCDAFAFIYDQAGDPAPDILVVLRRVIDAGGNPILLGPKTTVTDSAGSFHFTLPELATAFISARASALWNCPDGRAFTVPVGPSGELVPDFSLPSSTLVQPPLVYVGDVLSIPKASETQDGYLSAADYVAFLAGATMETGVVSFNLRTGEVTLLSQDITAALGFIPLGATIPGVAGTWANPSSITVNNKGQVIHIVAGGPPDTTPPTITVTTPTVSGTSVTINWTTDEPADSLVDYGVDATYGTSTPLDTEPVTDHHVTISGLNPGTPYHYQVKSTDTAGNPQTSSDQTFMTGAAPDTTPPTITINAPTVVTHNSATVNWTTNEPADSLVEYGTTLSYGQATTLDATLVTAHHIALSGLLSLQTYHYKVTSKDAAGNPRTSPDATFMTLAAPDTTAPIITLLPESAVGQHTVTVNWTTDELSDSQVEYGLSATSPPYGTLTPIDATMTTDHHVTISTGLSAGVLYHYRVKSKNAVNLTQTSADATFTTTPASGLDLMTGLISYWKLEEATGNRVDSHGPNHFAPVTGLGGIGPPSNAVGRLGNAVSFPDPPPGTETGSYLEAPDDLSQRMTGDFAITCWFWVHETSFYCNLPSMLSMWIAGELGYCLLFNALSWVWQFSVSGDGATQVDCTIDGPAVTKEVRFGPDPLSGYHFVCAQYEAATGTMSLSIDDGPVTTKFAGFTGQIHQSFAPLQVGAFDVYRRTFADADEIALYGRLLSPAEVTALAAAPTFPF